jgi:hypothetical protein
MSKSDKDSAIFMEDPASEVERKLMSAYCPKAEDAAVTAVAAEVRSLKLDLEVGSGCICRSPDAPFPPTGVNALSGG